MVEAQVDQKLFLKGWRIVQDNGTRKNTKVLNPKETRLRAFRWRTIAQGLPSDENLRVSPADRSDQWDYVCENVRACEICKKTRRRRVGDAPTSPANPLP